MKMRRAKALLSIAAALVLILVMPDRGAAAGRDAEVREVRRATRTKQKQRRNRNRAVRPVTVSQPDVIDLGTGRPNRAEAPVPQDPNAVYTLTTDDVNHGRAVSEWRHEAIDAWKASGQSGPPPWAGVGGGPGGNPNHVGRGPGAGHGSNASTTAPIRPEGDNRGVRKPKNGGARRTDRVDHGPRVVEPERGGGREGGKGRGRGPRGGKPDANPGGNGHAQP
jgi:hypothetical protein